MVACLRVVNIDGERGFGGGRPAREMSGERCWRASVAAAYQAVVSEILPAKYYIVHL